ncbi:MAG: T9SS type A sorting domain-containing protein [Bacteroidota bacterium]
MKTKTLLRTIALSCVLCLASNNFVKAQYFTIPDNNFATWLRTHGWDTCMVGNQIDTVFSKTYKIQFSMLDLSYQNISDLTGIEYIKWCSNINSCISRNLNASHNNLTEFPLSVLKVPTSFGSVDVSYNNIDTIILNRSYSLGWSFNLSHNNMKAFLKDTVYFPTEFNAIDLSYNDLDTMVTIYGSSSGYNLNIRGNRLRHFPPGNLRVVDVGVNEITSAPVIWSGYNNLLSLTIDSNQLTSLNLNRMGYYWHQISKLDCSHNAITSITNLQFPSMGSNGAFICNDNNLTSIPHLPTNTRTILCHNNPNLQCIPNLPNVTQLTLNYSNTAVQCLPRQFPNCIYNSTPSINAVPTCDMYNNIYACPQYSNMEGFVYSDIDSNCVDSADLRIGYIKAKFRQNGVIKQQIYTDRTGHYSFDEINYGTYTLEIDTTRLPVTVLCPDSAYYSATVDSQQLYQSGFDFGLNCKNGFDIGNRGASTQIFMPMHTTPVRFYAGDMTYQYGLRCAAGISGQVQVTYSGPITFVGPNAGALTPANVAGNVITWNIPDFGNLNPWSAFGLLFVNDSTAQMNDRVCFSISITPTVGDNNVSNNSFSFCDVVAASYDPNDKKVYPSDNIDTLQKLLTYTVRFQNTGTAPARHVLITDTLDSNLDFTTFELLNYSHENITQISENGLVKFNFPNINLPDSNTSEPLSHGHIQYQIKLKDNLPIGTQINNTAFIYFDFNAPVVTNTTSNTIAVINAVGEVRNQKSEIRVYPNPSSDAVTISIDETMLGSTATITDITGRKMAAVELQTANYKLSTENFNNGVYFVTVSNERGSITKKLVVSR